MAIPLAGLLGRFTSQTASETLGFGVGVALAEALRPEATQLGQESWSADPAKALDAQLVAAIVAEAVEQLPWGTNEASLTGINSERFQALLGEALNAPGVGELLRMRRRKTIDRGAFLHGLRKSKFEERWDDAIAELEHERLEPAEIAKAIHRGIMRGQGLLVAVPPTGAGRVPQVPPSSLDPVEEAEASGYDAERLRVLVGNAGLPPGVQQMLELLNRGEITEDDFLRGVGESNMRNEWGDAVLALRRRLLTPNQYAELLLRGWIDRGEMHQGAALVGMEPSDADLLAQLLGRPLSFHQTFIGLRRGGRYDGPTDAIHPAFLHSLRQSNVRPEWYDLAWAQRYAYPSTFVLRGMAQAGELTEAETEDILLFEGWEPTLAKKVAARWAAGSGGAGKEATLAELTDEYAGGYVTEKEFRDAILHLGFSGHDADLLVHRGDATRIKRYREKAVDAIAAAYVSFKIADTQATSELAELNVTGQAAEGLVAVWGKQRLDSVRLLTPAQIKKAFRKAMIDRETALDALEDQHYSPADAATLLDE